MFLNSFFFLLFFFPERSDLTSCLNEVIKLVEGWTLLSVYRVVFPTDIGRMDSLIGPHAAVKSLTLSLPWLQRRHWKTTTKSAKLEIIKALFPLRMNR